MVRQRGAHKSFACARAFDLSRALSFCLGGTAWERTWGVRGRFRWPTHPPGVGLACKRGGGLFCVSGERGTGLCLGTLVSAGGLGQGNGFPSLACAF